MSKTDDISTRDLVEAIASFAAKLDYNLADHEKELAKKLCASLGGHAYPKEARAGIEQRLHEEAAG